MANAWNRMFANAIQDTVVKLVPNPVLQGNGVKTAGTIVLASMELSATL